MTVRGLEIRFERLLFGARWLLAPLYAGMALALIAIVVVFARELIAELGHLAILTGEQATVLALSLIDLSLIGNLLMVVMLAGYESFVSQLRIDMQEDRPEWLGTIDFAGLKLKVIASIVAISAIALLRSFLLLGEPGVAIDETRLRWMVVIQLTFVVSGVLLALMDWISSRTPSHPAPKH
ncbi:MAG: TIGR00645 family protein [Gammaproteobacteria bacterium]|nr:TIGR00645 family protein [Gammaproteobacteria bacterium]MDE2262607.1 TIGR00645 family protein [Gammaproteobacteria bacterium]